MSFPTTHTAAPPGGQGAPRPARSRARGEPLAAAWLAAVVESSDDAIVSKTLDGIITSWNRGAEQLFGYAAEEVVGGPVSILAAPGREAEMPAILERIRRGEKVDHYETLRRRKDGELVEIGLTVSPIYDRRGRIVGASKIARDVGARRRTERALRESEERFRLLANTVPDIVWTATPDGTITFANDRWFRFCGLSPEQSARQWPHVVLHPDDLERCREQWRGALRAGTEYEIELRIRRHDGEYRWFLTRAVPVRDAEGQLAAWFGCTTDIHDRKQAEARQRTLTAELSHRVKNMLAVVQVLAERSGSSASSVADYLTAFRGRLQALSAAHNALVAADWRGANLRTLAGSMLEPFLGENGRVQLDIEDVALEPELALTLAVGLHELATNAAKYGALSNPSGRLTVSAHVAAGESGEELRLLWQEVGGPAVAPPTTGGFGTTMLTQAIEYQHRGRAELDWRREGLLCRLVVPLAGPATAPDQAPQ